MDEEKELESKLKQYPSNFDLLEEVEKMSKDSVNRIKEKILDEYKSTPYDTNMETIRAWNLISFLSYILGDETEAFEYNSKVLNLDMNNLVGLCNKAWFCLKRNEQYSIVKGVCDQLKVNLPSKEDFLVAKAELAYCYSKFGIKRYEKAKMLFKEVLDACSEFQNANKRSRGVLSEMAESKQLKIPSENMCVWTFNYALTFRRLLHISNVHDLSLDVSKQAHVTACDLYCRIIGMSGQSQCLDRYKARSYVELGTLVYNARKNKARFPNGVKDILPDHRQLWLATETYFTEALSMCPNDVFVLEWSGKFYRYIKQTDRAIEYLKKAIEIRGHSFCHHHLALALMHKLEVISTSNSRSVKDKERQTVSRNLFETKEKEDNSAQTNHYGDRSMQFGTNTTLFQAPGTGNPNFNLPDTDVTSSGSPYLSHNESTEQISSMLQHTSLDSAYKTMSCTSSLQKSRHIDGAFDKSNHLLVHTTEDQTMFYEQRQAIDCGNKSLHQQEGCVNQRAIDIKMIKSPKKPTHIDKKENEETIAKIIFHLDKSYEKSNNCWAIYDKGLLYRQIDQPEEALETFKKLIRNKSGYCSLVQLSNAYEQAGLCLHDILSTSAGNSKSLECDMRQYFKKSIEISCKIVSNIPFLKECWVSAPTLRDFLLGKAETKDNLKDLSFLFKKFESYGEAIDVLNQLKKLAEDDTETAEIDIELVENCLRLGKYDDAVLTLDMIMCLPNGFSFMDESLYMRVHIDGGVDALKNGDTEMARLRLKNALDFTRCNNENKKEDDNDEQETDREEDEYDLFILCNADIEERIEGLMMVMEEFTLRVTLNFCHVVPGVTKLSGLYTLMRRSMHFLIVCDEKPLDKQMLYNFEMMKGVIFERGYGHTVVLSVAQDVTVPKHMSNLPRIVMELNFDAEDAGTKSYNNENVCKKMKEILFKLACSNLDICLYSRLTNSVI